MICNRTQTLVSYVKVADHPCLLSRYIKDTLPLNWHIDVIIRDTVKNNVHVHCLCLQSEEWFIPD